jgi:hypothetical protein
MIGFSHTISKIIDLSWLILAMGVVSYFLPITDGIFWLSTGCICCYLVIAILRIGYKIYQETVERKKQ